MPNRDWVHLVNSYMHVKDKKWWQSVFQIGEFSVLEESMLAAHKKLYPGLCTKLAATFSLYVPALGILSFS